MVFRVKQLFNILRLLQVLVILPRVFVHLLDVVIQTENKRNKTGLRPVSRSQGNRKFKIKQDRFEICFKFAEQTGYETGPVKEIILDKTRHVRYLFQERARTGYERGPVK